MNADGRKVHCNTVSGRKIFVCDGAIAPGAVLAVEAAVKALSFTRTEASLLGMAPTASSAEIPATPLMASFIGQLQGAAEQLFSGETFRAQRAYVNRSVYGDAYYVHRDLCAVTVLYYVNLVWEPDWGGETIYFDDDNDAQLVVSPRPGRLVVARGDILHRASVPARDCPEERLTIALKLANA